MFVSGYIFIRNAEKYDYPVSEAILSVLPLVEEMIVLVGNSDDNTLGIIQAIGSDKIKIHHSVWDDSLREGGRVFAEETRKAMALVSPKADWVIGLQADECLHENEYASIQKAMTDNLKDTSIDGLLFDYLHFYGDYNFVGNSRKWYKREIRVIRNRPDIFPYKDSQGFRKGDNKKLVVKHSGAKIYHYSWVKPPAKQKAKLKFFHSRWHSDDWVDEHLGKEEEFDYSTIDALKRFEGIHPKIYAERIARYNAPVGLKEGNFIKAPLKKFLFWWESLTGWRIGEYKNYILVR